MIALPSWRDWLFSVKAFTAAMLALFVAMGLGLPRPYWAMATVYVVSNPLTGATRSKGLYRACGTLLGAAAAVVMVPALVDEPVLLSLVLSLWTGTLLYLSMLHRTPRSYVFMLSAYSLPLIALPAVYHPEQVFDIAIARSEEILLGIVCAAVVASLVFPGSVAPVLSAKIKDWLRDAAAWGAETLAPHHPRAHTASRHRLAADILALDQFISQLSYDAPSADIVDKAGELRGRLSMLMPLLASITGAATALRRQPGGVPPELHRVMEDVAQWMEEPAGAATAERAEALQERLARLASALRPASGDAATEQRLLATLLQARLRSLLRLWQDCVSLADMIATGHADQRWQPLYRRWELGGQARHYDYGMMIFSAVSVSLAVFVACVTWIGWGWNDGGGAVIMAAIAACFYAAQDEPARSQRDFFIWNSVCLVLSAVLLFVAIPATYDFVTLAMALAVPFLLIGTLATKPQFTTVAMTLTVTTASVMGLSGAYSADFLTFFNGNLASISGVLFALVWTLLTRPFGAEMALRRLVHATWADLSRTAAGRHDGDYAQLTSRMIDRLNLLLPRLAASGDDRLTDGFTELQVGFNTLDLQRDEHQLPGPAGEAIHEVLQSLSRHFETRADAQAAAASLPRLARDIDAALRATAREAGPAAREALNALTSLRVCLLPEAGAEPALAGGAA